MSLVYYVYKNCLVEYLCLNTLFHCCSKDLEQKVEDSLRQVKTIGNRPIVVKQYQYGASIEDIASAKLDSALPLLESSVNTAQNR